MSITASSEPPFNKMARQTNKLLDQLQKGYYSFYPGETWTPNVNLYETDNVYLICVDLAGVDKSKIDLAVHEGRMKIKGSRAVPSYDENPDQESNRKVRVHLMEIDHGSFVREVELPEGAAAERITAVYRNGMLWIEIPKS